MATLTQPMTDYLFVQPTADVGVFGGNMFEAVKVFI